MTLTIAARPAVRHNRGAMAVAALGVALAADAVLGEPVASVHPVVWLGRAIDCLAANAPRRPPAAFVYGAGMACGVPAGAALAALAVERSAARLPWPLAVLAIGLAFKPAFAVRALLGAGQGVERSLRAGDLDGARRAVRALVGRDPAALDAPLLAAAAVESLAENLGDSVAGPLLAYALCGLPGAWAYRALNTLDSMVGYHGAFEWLGKASARLDDVANLLPARAAAVALVVGAGAFGGSPAGAAAAARDHAGTESPNAGWPMAAMAGALGVRLEKLEHYVLNPAGRPPTPHDITAARRLTAAGACVLGAGAAALTAARVQCQARR